MEWERNEVHMHTGVYRILHTHTHTHTQNPPLHLVAFGPNGHLVTAAVESNIVKIWPPLSQSNIVTTPDSSIAVKHEQGQEEAGCVYRYRTLPLSNIAKRSN